MADTTEQALRAHMAKWGEKGRPGFNSSPLGRLEEKVRWLCEELDRRAEPAFFEEESSRIARAIARRRGKDASRG